jgi:hypothetical protein
MENTSDKAPVQLPARAVCRLLALGYYAGYSPERGKWVIIIYTGRPDRLGLDSEYESESELREGMDMLSRDWQSVTV